MTKLTETQRKILLNRLNDKPCDYGRPAGRSAAGGWDRSIKSCLKHGWLSWPFENITTAGRTALKAHDA